MIKDSVTIKGTKEGLIVYCDEAASWSQVIDNLQARLQGKEGNFFDGASVTVDIGCRLLTPHEVGLLWDTFQGKGLNIKCLKAGSPEEKNAGPNSNKLRPAGEPDDASSMPTLVVQRSVRSGQNIEYGGNIIVLGDVNPGAEIEAAGFIMVWGDLRGTVHAGAEGNKEAWVAAFRLQPTQLRIAHHITRAPEEEPREPEIAQLNGDIVVVRECKKWTNYYDIRGN